MKRFPALSMLVLLLILFAGCDSLYFSIRFANTGITGIDIKGVYMTPAGGQYGENLLPVEKLQDGKYFVLEGLDRWSDYDFKVVFDFIDPDTSTWFEYETLGNVPVPPPADCVTWTAYYNYYAANDWNRGGGYSWGCEDEFDYDLVGD